MTNADGVRDYVEWHRYYDDPGSDMSWRLSIVQDRLRLAFDTAPGDTSVLSLCAGDGRDVLGVLAEREDRARFRVTLVELDPTLAARARDGAAALDVTLDVREGDAGRPAGYNDAVPADVVLLVGIFGNISDLDIRTTIAATPSLCRPGASVLWSRGRHRTDRNDAIRGWFADAGFTELDYQSVDAGSRPALGTMRYDGPPTALPIDAPLFTFVR